MAKNDNCCAIYKEGEYFVHFMIGKFHSHTKSYENFYQASKAQENWIDKGEE